jgi:regulator of sirC expression with transglutaminase-like and TPR domain
MAQAGPTLLRELSRISQAFDPTLPADWMVKRVQFFAYELMSLVGHPGSSDSLSKSVRALSVIDRVKVLNRFFFEQKGFSCRPIATGRTEDWLLHEVISRRTGSPPVIALLYVLLAERLGLETDWVTLPASSARAVLRIADSPRSHHIDLTAGGRLLDDQDLLDLIALEPNLDGKDGTRPAVAFLVDYIKNLKATIDLESQPNRALFLQDLLVAWVPSDLRLLAERAQIHRRLGNLSVAWNDLKRYFSFFEKDHAPDEIRALFGELEERLRQPSHTQEPSL